MSAFHIFLGRFPSSMEIGLAFCRRALATNPAAVSLLLALLIHRASGLPVTHPLRPAVDEINESGPFVGLVMAYSAESDALRSSGEFIPSSHLPWLDLYGRRFHIGSIRDCDLCYVWPKKGKKHLPKQFKENVLPTNQISTPSISYRYLLNAGITVQILLDVFVVRGIVHYGTTGSANDSMSFGDVSIPKYVAFTGSWTWMKFDSETKMANMLIFGAYNAPAEGKNLLSSVVFKSEDLFVDGKPMVEVFWLQMESQWYEIAKQLKVKLQRCANESFCLPEDPKMVFGLKASTADVFVDNAAYRQFLFNEFGVSTVDQESAAVVQTAMASGVPIIVFRGVSDLAGGEATWSSSFLGDLACINALKASVEFIGILGRRQTLSSS